MRVTVLLFQSCFRRFRHGDGAEIRAGAFKAKTSLDSMHSTGAVLRRDWS